MEHDNTLLHTPLSEEEMDILKTLRVSLWANELTGQVYIHKHHWLSVPEGKRNNIRTAFKLLREREGQP
jgi:hypothetical protein